MYGNLSRTHFRVIYSLIFIQFVLLMLATFFFMNRKQSLPASRIFEFENPVEKYTMYIGTNDKDTYKLEIPLDECKRRIDAICTKHVEGFSVDLIKGNWVDEGGVMTDENTYVYIFYNTSDEAIKNIMDEVLVQLNQNTILIEKEYVTSSFYSGK